MFVLLVLIGCGSLCLCSFDLPPPSYILLSALPSPGPDNGRVRYQSRLEGIGRGLELAPSQKGKDVRGGTRICVGVLRHEKDLQITVNAFSRSWRFSYVFKKSIPPVINHTTVLQ